MVVGSIEILPIVDAVGNLGDLAELYPETPAEARDPFRQLYPDLFAGTNWNAPCTSYLIRGGARWTLFFAGAIPMAAGLVAIVVSRRRLFEPAVSGAPA